MNNQKYAIVAKNISKRYKMYKNSKEKLLDLMHPKGCGSDFYALKDLSFKIEKGKSVGLIGVNGAGKSTLSNILAGVSIPTTGEIEINGEPAIIAIGSGLNNFLTGLENIEMKALMMGFDKDKIEEIKQNVIEFAEIGEFINQPIRTYSSGMRSRLGFAISIHIDPDIMVIDEALSVGDPTFTNKCLEKMNEFKQNGKTIFFVSHSISQVKEFCDEAMWLEYGMIKDYGTVEEILPKYQEYLNMINKMSSNERKTFKENILKEQKHHLLKEFKLINPKYKNPKLTGKLIKYARLVNKKGSYKVIPYNFDYKMFMLGSISSFINKQYSYAMLVLILELVSIFVSPGLWGIFTRFLLTFVLALFSGKKYTNELIENKGYIPYEIYKEEIAILSNELSKNINPKKINNAIKREKKIFITLFTVLTIGIISNIYMYLDKTNDIKDLNTNEVEVVNPVNINEKILLVIESDGMAKKFAFLDLSNESIISEYYPGELLVQYKEQVMLLNEIYIEEGCIPEEVIEGTLKKQGYSQIMIDERLLKENNVSLKKDAYKNILLNLFNSDDDTLLNRFKGLDDESITEFRTSISSIKNLYKNNIDEKYRTQKGTYKYKSIEEITSEYIIRYYALDKNSKYYYINDSDLEKYEDIVRIRELERQQSEVSEEDEEINSTQFEQTTTPSVEGNSGGSTRPNGGENSGGSTRPNGGGSTGGSTTPNGGGNSGGSTTPDGGGSSGETTTPNGGSGDSDESTTPPSEGESDSSNGVGSDSESSDSEETIN